MSDVEPPQPHALPPEPPQPPAEPPTGPTSAPMPEPTPPKKAWRSWVAAGAAAAVVAAGAAIVIGRSSSDSSGNTAAAAAQTPAGGGYSGPGGGFPGGRGTQGTIASIDGTTLSLTATSQDGTTSTMKVTTTGDTTYTETVTGQVSDIAVGDNVVVIGTTSGSGVAATAITDRGTLQAGGFGGGFPGGGYGPPNGAPPQGANGAPNGSFPGGSVPAGGNGGPGGPNGGGFTAGQVASVDGSTITVTAQDGSAVKVTTTSSTTVSVTKQISLSDLAVGDTVRVNGTVDGTTVAATSIQKGDLTGGFFGRGGPGAQRPQRRHRPDPADHRRLTGPADPRSRRTFVSRLRRILRQPWLVMPVVAVLALGGWYFLRRDDAATSATTQPTSQTVQATVGTMDQTITARRHRRRGQDQRLELHGLRHGDGCQRRGRPAGEDG